MQLDERGVTLLELLAAMFIMALLVALAFPVLVPVLDDIRLKGDAQRLAWELRAARQEAIATGNHRSVYLYPFGNYYRVEGQSSCSLQKGVEFDGITFGAAYPSGPPACIFSASGAPQPRAGTVVLTNQQGHRLYIIVNPVMGRIRISDTAPVAWTD